MFPFVLWLSSVRRCLARKVETDGALTYAMDMTQTGGVVRPARNAMSTASVARTVGAIALFHV